MSIYFLNSHYAHLQRQRQRQRCSHYAYLLLELSTMHVCFLNSHYVTLIKHIYFLNSQLCTFASLTLELHRPANPQTLLVKLAL